MVVLVTGANGQLGQCLQQAHKKYAKDVKFIFCDSEQLNITNQKQCDEVFDKYKPNYCINTAAYTAVDKAEGDADNAHIINVLGSENLALASKKFNCTLLHISTDFVFDGNKNNPYLESDIPNPLGIYGKTKLESELVIQKIWNQHIIVRTAWVYSPFGNNFMKTMLRLAEQRDEISVVNDQIGTPTNALDLAEALLKIILTHYECQEKSKLYGVFHFTNEGDCSWYEFAFEIFKIHQKKIKVNPIPTTAYPTPAKRPAYSVLDKNKIKTTFNLEITNWKESLKQCMFEMDKI